MDFIKRWFKKKNLDYFCGMGDSTFNSDTIDIKDYPLEPSSIFPSKEILATEINDIHVDEFPPTLRLNNELIFITREKVVELKEFAIRNNVLIAERESNWSFILEPYLDTEFSDEHNERTTNRLSENGIHTEELTQLRQEIGPKMFRYNFDTMLWEWANLGLLDVLSAMRLFMNKNDFKEFYWRAMEIEQRHS